MIQKIKHIIFIVLSVFLLGACGTYYQKSQSTERALIIGDYQEAKDQIEKNKFLNRKRNKLLFNLEMGKACHLNGDFDESNKYFNEADRLTEEHQSILDMSFGVLVNPAIQTYQSEPHEQFMMHYYKALNYIQLGMTEDAIVEARRINLKENALDISAKRKEKKYHKDPFGLIMMGMIYESVGDNNNAFIAYRNAKEVYSSDQTGLFHGRQPATLENDIIRTAKRSGISYEGVNGYDDSYAENGELILFWENGLAPIKEEENLMFSLDENKNGYFFKSNNIEVPVSYDFDENNEDFESSDLGLLRIANSFYVNRKSRISRSRLSVNNEEHQLSLGQDITALAFQIEKENYFKKLGNNLLRLALKKLSELALSDQNEVAGALLGITNFATEKADTRNWQSLPSQIQFARIPLNKGENHIEMQMENGEEISFDIEGNGKMIFKNIVTY